MAVIVGLIEAAVRKGEGPMGSLAAGLRGPCKAVLGHEPRSHLIISDSHDRCRDVIEVASR